MPAEQLATTQPGAAGEVVILCAEEEVRDVIAYWFTSLPACTIVAADGYQANRILHERDCRLLVVDRVLPPWPGMDTLRVHRVRNPRLRIAYVDNGDIQDRILAGVVGATDYFLRPLSRKSVVEALTRADAVA
jgi:DNA-binding response OmpR family regulator